MMNLRTVSKKTFNDTRSNLRGKGKYVKKEISHEEFVRVTESKEYPSTFQMFPHVYTVFVDEGIYTMKYNSGNPIFTVEQKEVSGMN